MVWTRGGLLGVLLIGCLLPTATWAQDSNATTDRQTDGQTDAATTTDSPRPATVANPASSTEQTWFEAIDTVWNKTLFTAGSTDIKLNQLVIALLVVLIGLWLSRRVTLALSDRLVRSNRMTEQVAYTLGKIVYYVSAAMVVLIAMQVAGIPTTVFTVLGGALAIGVGFGAQNLCNNLISGIIILTEKPIRRRDIVEIDGMEGVVAEIGNRRTRIRKPDGIDVLVPNSTFLESNVVNWTLFDSHVRGHVGVGVAYGSPVKQVRDLLLEAANEHERIDKAPPPVVLFTEFGDNTLNFSLYFWTNVTRPIDRRQIESDLRFEIDEKFKQSSVVIAFPQRDVHLDTLRPLEVKMVKDSGDKPT